jgi:hypothetical protein
VQDVAGRDDSIGPVDVKADAPLLDDGDLLVGVRVDLV